MMGIEMDAKRNIGLSPIRKFAALLLCIVLALSYGGFLSFLNVADAAETHDGPTQSIVAGSRIADPDTHDTYVGQLLGGDIYGSLVLQPDSDDSGGGDDDTLTFKTNGSRYAGRLWADKSVFANGEDAVGNSSSNGDAWNPDLNQLNLSIATDGYRGAVATNDDFLHIYSVLGSSQLVNTYPPNPIDLVFVVDVSGSMGTVYQKGAEGDFGRPAANAEAFENSQIYATVEAINEAIVELLRVNPGSRIGIVVYGSTAATLVPGS